MCRINLVVFILLVFSVTVQLSRYPRDLTKNVEIPECRYKRRQR
mgnify:CR=1 FL=1